MNTESESVKNFLFVVKDTNYARNFHKLCLECIQKNDHTTLFITKKPFNLLTLLSEFELFKEQLKKCILMYFERIDDVVQKLLELHTWAMLPVLVVIDLQGYLEDYNKHSSLAGPTSVPAMKSICLCIATLFTYMRSVERRMTALKPKGGDGTKAEAHSVVLLGEREDILTRTQLELLINLYFYNETAFDDYNELKSRIVDTWI